MKIGIICAMNEEIKVLKNNLVNPHVKNIGNKDFYEGKLCNQDVVLVESGIGKVQAAFAATVLLAMEKVDAIINTGSAAGIGKDLKIGDIVITDSVAYHDVDSTACGYLPGQLPDQPAVFKADADLISKIKLAADMEGLNYYTGLIVSGDQFISSKQKINEILEKHPNALAAEMESAAVGQMAHQFNKPFVIIRAMSDTGNDDANVNFNKFVIEAGAKSAKMLMDFLKLLSNNN